MAFEIYLYRKKQSTTNDQIYAFENLNTNLTIPLAEEVENHKASLVQNESREYNPLIKEREKVDTINKEVLKSHSNFFANLYEYFNSQSNEGIETVEDFDENSKYSLMIYKNDNDVFVKQFHDNKLLSENSLIGEFTQREVKKISNKILIFDGNFDFYFSLNEDRVMIKNSSRFEKICNYEAYFNKIREDKIIEIRDTGIISNFDDVYEELDNKKYNRLYTQLDTMDIKKITSNSDLIRRISRKGIIFSNDSFEIEKPENSFILLFLISGLISINNFDQVVISKDHELIIDKESPQNRLPAV